MNFGQTVEWMDKQEKTIVMAINKIVGDRTYIAKSKRRGARG